MKRKRDGKLLDELLDQMRRRRNVTKARAGWKLGRGAPDELEGVGEAFSCSFEPFHQKYDLKFTKNTSNWICVQVLSTWLLLFGVHSPLPSPSLLVSALSTSSPSPSQTHLVKQI